MTRLLPALAPHMLAISLMIASAADATEAEGLQSSCAEDVDRIVQNPALRVLTLNASHGRGTAINQLLVGTSKTYENLDGIADLLSREAADVVALQEADAPSRWSGKFDHVAYVAENAAYPCFVHGLHSQGYMSSYGTALLMRSEALEPASIAFPPSPPSKQKGFVSTEFLWRPDTTVHRVTVASVHFDFMRKKTRDRQVAEMVNRLKSVEGPLVVLGDLNSEWTSEDSHVGRLASELGLHTFEPENGGLGTYKKLSGKRLDWILVSRDLAFRSYRVLTDRVADHFPIYAELIYVEGENPDD